MRKIISIAALILLTICCVSRAWALASTEGKQGMMVLGDNAVSFQLEDVVSGKTFSLEDFKTAPVMMIVIYCRHCPFVQHVKDQIASISKDYKDKGVAMIALASNDASFYPDDSPARLKEMALETGLQMPVLYDADQSVAKALTAVATPDFYIFDKDRKLVYRGQLDDSRPGNKEPVDGHDVREALDKLLSGQEVSKNQKPSSGCSIKWKKGNQPGYWS